MPDVLDQVEARFNVASDGKRFRCDFMREGPVYYPEIKKGIECVRRKTIEAGLNSFVGRPATIEHVDVRLNAEDPKVRAVTFGIVDKVGFDADNGWAFLEGEVTDADRARQAAALNPSCGFRVLSTGPGGRWNNVPYERELTQIEFHHLAMSKSRSRYEESDFRLNAVTNDQGETTMFKFLFKKKDAADPAAAPVTVEHDVPADTVVKIGTKEVRLNSLIEAEEKAQQAEADKVKTDAEATARLNAASAINDDTEVLVSGKPVKIGVLRASAEARENAVSTAAARKAAEGRESFDTLAAARGRQVTPASISASSNSLQDQLARGASEYGSAAKN